MMYFNCHRNDSQVIYINTLLSPNSALKNPNCIKIRYTKHTGIGSVNRALETWIQVPDQQQTHQATLIMSAVLVIKHLQEFIFDTLFQVQFCGLSRTMLTKQKGGMATQCIYFPDGDLITVGMGTRSRQ